MRGKWVVIVTDIQGDFTEFKKGSLAVPGTGVDYVRNVESATRRLKELGFLILGTQDWHPPDHVSFATSHPGKKTLDTVEIQGRTQVLWPPHCVQGTENARILIDNNLFLAVVKKAQDRALESYSAFQDESGVKTEMETILRINGVERLIIYGIATDYCVRATALDGRAAGFPVTVVEDLCRGVSRETTAAAIAEMKRMGVMVTPTLDEILREVAP